MIFIDYIHLYLIRIHVFDGGFPGVSVLVPILKNVHLVIFTFFMTAPVPVRFPLQGLTLVLSEVKRHSHLFFALGTQGLLVRSHGIDEESVLPLGDLTIQLEQQVLHGLANVSKGQRHTQIHGAFQCGTQALPQVTRVHGRFDQMLDLLSHHERQELGAQQVISVIQRHGHGLEDSKQDLVQLLDVRHDIPFVGEQIRVMLRFQQGEDLVFPLGAFLQEFAHRPCLVRHSIKQEIKHQEIPESLGDVQTIQVSDFPSADRLNQTANLVTVTKQHFTAHLDELILQIVYSYLYTTTHDMLIGVYTMSL